MLKSQRHAFAALACSLLLLVVASGASALDANVKCQADKLKTAAKYGSCRLGAESKAVKLGGAPDFATCQSKYSAKWQSIETKAGAGVCPSEGDEAGIDQRIVDHAGDLAVLLAGGTLPACGDAIADAGEQCDGADLAGETCTSLGYTDGGTLTCDASCSFDTSGCACDTCAPDLCGNATADAGEQCDGADLAGETCTSLGYTDGGTLACDGDCGFDISGCACDTCPPDLCGNATADAGEQCDGADLAGETCMSLGYTNGGTLACDAGCGFDTSGCACDTCPPDLCGNATIDAPEQCDGADLGGQTCTSLGYTLGGTLACDAGCGFDTTGCASQEFPASGQATTYGTGDDGDLEPGATLAYVDNGDGTISDLNTGLMWEKKIALNNSAVNCTTESGSCTSPHDVDNRYTWTAGTTAYDGRVVTIFLEQLNDRCDNDTTLTCATNSDCSVPGGPCGFAGHRDWRLPSIKELQSILNYQNMSPSVSAAFNGASCGPACTDITNPACSCTFASNHWSSTTYAFNTALAWFFHFNDSSGGANSKAAFNFARAVRGGL